MPVVCSAAGAGGGGDCRPASPLARVLLLAHCFCCCSSRHTRVPLFLLRRLTPRAYAAAAASRLLRPGALHNVRTMRGAGLPRPAPPAHPQPWACGIASAQGTVCVPCADEGSVEGRERERGAVPHAPRRRRRTSRTCVTRLSLPHPPSHPLRLDSPRPRTDGATLHSRPGSCPAPTRSVVRRAGHTTRPARPAPLRGATRRDTA